MVLLLLGLENVGFFLVLLCGFIKNIFIGGFFIGK